jgi:hypothetical protein
VPPRLVTAEAMIEAARVAPLTLVNVVDNRSARDVRAVASALALAYPLVWTLGQRSGNAIVAGCATAQAPNLSRIAARAAADPSPARLALPSQIAPLITSISPLRDNVADEGGGDP